MPDNLTPKQEAFCQKYIELGCATKAYYAAYDAAGSKPITANRSAKTLLDNPKIAARLRDLRDRALRRHDVTVDTVTAELEAARQQAMEINQISAAVNATMGKAKIHGLVEDRMKVTRKIEDLSDDELAALARSKGLVS